MRRVSFALGLLAVAGCSERGSLQMAEPVSGATVERVWAAKFRSDIQADRRGTPPRPTEVRYQAIDVSVPPTHQLGQIEWPDGEPDAARHFVTLAQDPVSDLNAFARAVARADDSGLNETFVFVHGYNMRHGEAVYQVTQFTHDFDVPTPKVLFSWPSAGLLVGYVHDRDSALVARDELEELLLALSSNGRRVMLVAHSMGTYLTMETLRQMALKGIDVDGRINGVIFVAPDIDGDLFQDQARDIGKLPEPFVLMVAEQDIALRASAWLTGFRPRLGAQTDRSVVGDLPVSVVDVSRLAAPNDNTHAIAISSPTAIRALQEIAGATPPGEADVPDLVVLGDGS
ncbi:MAG: alpha/beta fold hydrolase [Pseudomonadota bacterium]